MKRTIQTHKILLITLSAVLGLGIVSALIAGILIRTSGNSDTFETVAEAKQARSISGKSQALRDDEPLTEHLSAEPTPSPKPEDVKLSADDVKRISREVQNRRRPVIPVRSDVWVADNTMLWKETDPDAKQAETAQLAAEKLTQTLFEQSYESLTGYQVNNATVRLFTDPTGDRDAFLRITDPQGIYILAGRLEDQKLLCADLLVYPEAPAKDREKACIAIAEKLGYHAVHYRRDTNGQYETVYDCKTDTDVCLSFSYIYDRLWQVAVYPNQQALLECEYFLADIQMDYSNPAYPKDFVEAEPPKLGRDKMVSDEKIFASLSRLYKSLSGEELDTSKLKATFLRDNSGAREDCWQITGEGFDIVVSAYSRDVISFTGTIPCKELLSVPYEKMGGEEYETETKKIADYLITSLGAYDDGFHGKNAKEIDVNAVYDDHYCTMDIVTEEGAWYECYFADGVLKEIWHFADEKLFMDAPHGWVADAVYIHSVTGKPFIPEYRDWDGNLHVAKRPER